MAEPGLIMALRCNARFFQRPRVGSPGRICLQSWADSRTSEEAVSFYSFPISFSLGKSLCLVSLGHLPLSGAGLQKVEIQEKRSKSRVKATASCPLSVRSQPSSVPPEKLRHKSELVKITSLERAEMRARPTV